MGMGIPIPMHTSNEWSQLTQPQTIISFGAMLESYHKLQKKQK